jgi:hypothetical protein
VATKKSLLSGSLYGLQLQFYIGYDDRLSTFNAIYGKGGFLKVENSSKLLDDTLDGIFLAPGKYSVPVNFWANSNELKNSFHLKSRTINN